MPPTVDTEIGDTVLDPVSGDQVIVTDVLNDDGEALYVETDSGAYIITRTTVGDTFNIQDENGDDVQIQVASVVLGSSGYPVSVNVRRMDQSAGDLFRLDVVASSDAISEGSDGLAENIPTGNLPPGEVIHRVATGQYGSNGRDGYGVWKISREAHAGGNGATGPYYDLTVSLNGHGAINSNEQAGITIGSIGGNGGNGGDAYGAALSAKDGGNGGAGGRVSLTNSTTITTGGDAAHGIIAFSRSGEGGDAGSGYCVGFCNGGTGGGSLSGGQVTVSNSGYISTSGDDAHGLYGFSSGGAAGSGGDSWTLVGGGGGSGAAAGAGGNVTIENSGRIVTHGTGSRGIYAQSIGGSGGSAGSAGALLITLGGDGGTGGDGGNVEVINQVSGDITTQGDNADAILAQSIGEGGGSASGSFSLYAVGGSGSTGGDAGIVSVDNRGTLETFGDWARGIAATSIGGGGGSGGTTGAAVAIGGQGSGGGDGAAVTVTNSGIISTQGSDASGIYAQSTGGGGGDVGTTGGALSIGGDGSGGGTGGDVTVTNTGTIVTNGARSEAIYAHSLGGGGGKGSTAGALIALGGNGGAGNHSGQVTVIQRGSIETGGADATGILAQSVGGGGGNGGSAYSGSLFFGMSIGGKGGDGNNGGQVDVVLGNTDSGAGNARSLIETRGDRATGIHAQSVGKGGGNGGNAIQGTLGVGTSVSVALGGDGGSGGVGGAASVRGVGDIHTRGAIATGVLLESIGGGGGNGGTTVSGALTLSDGVGVSVAVGGDGGHGGHGGEVNLDLDTNILTEGDASTGLIAQSVGGSGGNAGTVVSAAAAVGSGGAYTVAVGVGGKGGNASDGGVVDANLSGSVATQGDQADAIVVQSIGGGGGNGSTLIAAGFAASAGTSGAINVGVGGQGGSGGNGNQVDAVLNANVTTQGEGSDGIIVQSVGGGGGNSGLTLAAGFAGAASEAGSVNVGVGGQGGGGGNGDIVNATYNGDLATFGDHASGLLVQSVGKGGGKAGGTMALGAVGAQDGAAAINVAVGGDGGNAGHGGRDGVDTAVTLNTSGSVSTSGNDASGIIAQSIGGGGGAGGFTISAALSGAQSNSGSIAVGLGGSGGGGGDGKDVIASLDSDIVTRGDDSLGALVQSVGGGGGQGGFNISAAASGSTSGGSGSISVGLGGTGGSGGDGGAVTSNSNGLILTRGDRATALTVQSVGGGGGTGGFNISAGFSAAQEISGAAALSIGGSGGSGGDGGTARSHHSGDIVTSGSTGMLTQSVGGGGGAGNMAISGAVSLSAGNSGAASVGVGGSGGGGGEAAAVISTFSGTIFTVERPAAGNDPYNTDDHKASGLIAQSIAGGGGQGALAINGAVSLSSQRGGALAIGIGGSGGGGGHSGSVSNLVEGYVETHGEGATGVLAQSVAGGGGSGGVNITGTVTGSFEDSGALAVGVGGSGGGGGHAGAVVSEINGGVATFGDRSSAIVAQSLGGGGGTGGVNITGGLNVSTEGRGALFGLGVGGAGGAAGHGGEVDTRVTTTESYSQIRAEGANASAVVAQSIGGGGGQGATNVTGAINLSNSSGGNLGVGVGGFGGDGGNGGRVNLAVVGDLVVGGTYNSEEVPVENLQWYEEYSEVVNEVKEEEFDPATTGPEQQAWYTTLADYFPQVWDYFTNANQAQDPYYIQINAADSNGILAQSIGGGGGNGGLNVTGALSASYEADSTNVSANIGVGGFGGGGGQADEVNLSFNGSTSLINQSLTAEPQFWDANGLVAQSIGGGGGNGGVNVSGGLALTRSGGNGEAVTIGVGGFGGAGGDAGAVTLNASAATENDLFQAHGNGRSAVLAQSIGGGGGSGGINISGGISSDSNVTIGVGGFGGEAGAGGNVNVNTSADLFSNGDFGQGLLAQSIGGGGGNGGFNVSGAVNYAAQQDTPLTLGLGVGGFGGDGAGAGQVFVDHTGDVITRGLSNPAIAAQSIGGGGGNGAFNITTQLLWADSSAQQSHDYAIVAGVGGSAGSGDAADLVNVLSAGSLTTEGDGARGIMAQSIGGGGGVGGFNLNLLAARASTPINVAVGGSGGDASNAGTVEVRHGLGDDSGASHRILTDGVGAHAIEASSIGGGGGDAGANFNIAVSDAGRGTQGNESVALQFTLGGDGGEAANGARVDVINHADIHTQQANSTGILAQSIGGGGGNGALNIAESYSGQNAQARSVNISVGGQPGDGGDAAAVTVLQAGSVTTNGVGILAQSIGGGGGNASMDYSFAQAKGGKLKVSVGREGGTGGRGGNVEVATNGDITTIGDNNYAIAAQSIGNGGGNSSSTTVALSSASPDSALNTSGNRRSINVSVGLEGGVGGVAGRVNVTTQGQRSITTTGDKAYGILAQSIGGGGGNGGSASASPGKNHSIAIAVGGNGGQGGTGGAVDIASDASISTSSAIGILAQSIGGGGGNGGLAKILALGVPDVYDSNQGGARINVAVGGSGGSGAHAEAVTLNNSGAIQTGTAYLAIREGDLEELRLAMEEATRVQQENSTAANEEALTTAVDAYETALNQPVNLHGILAQSIGGGGGTGGSSYVVTRLAESSSEASSVPSAEFNTAVGGNGGEGGFGQDVRVDNTGSITTRTRDSMGIFAQSVGGGGGNGGMALDMSFRNAEQASFGLAIGGSGGEGNRAGDVWVSNANSEQRDTLIHTQGARSFGILAMSVGGGGGNGEMATLINAGTQPSHSDSNVMDFSLALGGGGGNGGTGGTVSVDNSAMIVTEGNSAHGVAALSIGGGGGNGAMSVNIGAVSNQNHDRTAKFSIGGFGGSGNQSDDVTVTNTGSIVTYGDNAYGIMAQSIGGGGGNGGMAVNVNSSLVDAGTWFSSDTVGRTIANFSMGGLGGDGADSGNVTVNHLAGDIAVLGNNSYGIFAQTVSGAGGTASYSIGNPYVSAVDYVVTSQLGAKDGASGNAGTISINLAEDARIQVGNENHAAEGSSAIFAQRVIGGGGNDNIYVDLSNAAAAENNGTDFNAHDDGMVGAINGIIDMGTNLLDYGQSYVRDLGTGLVDDAYEAIFGVDTDCVTVNSSCSEEQNIVAGGGSSRITYQADRPTDDYEGIDINMVATLGSAGVSDGAAEAMTTTRTGTTQLMGDNSEATLVQNIGGGGGKLTSVMTWREAPSPGIQSQDAAVDKSSLPDNGQLSVNLGANQSTNAHGGDIDYRYEGDIAVVGDYSVATLVQSIGGGGGELRSVGTGLLNLALGGVNGTTGDGGDITLDREGSIYTDGIAAHGLIVQSIGGGGGAALTDTAAANVSVQGNAANAGDGGNVALRQQGDIQVQGEQSIALLVQSLGGGGGFVDRVFADTAGGDGASGNIDFELDGHAIASGEQGIALFVQSRGSRDQGDINIDIAEQKLVFGGSGGVGVSISGGTDNRVNNRGEVAGADGILAQAIKTEEGNDQFDNRGLVVGSVDMGAGLNRFNNHQEAIFLVGPALRVGTGASTLFNAGDLILGGNTLAQRLDLTGNFSQSNSGITRSELDFDTDEIDRVVATGRAELDGEINLRLLNTQYVPIGQFQKNLFEADNGVQNEGVALDTLPSAVIDYQLRFPSANRAVVAYKITFAPAGLEKHLSKVGDYINRIQMAPVHSSALDDDIIALVAIPDLATYSNSLTQISPEFYGEQQAGMLSSSAQFGRRLMSCAQADGEYRFAREGSCFWFNIEDEEVSHDNSDGYQSIETDNRRITLGGQQLLDNGWALGGGFSYVDVDSDGFDNRWNADGSAYFFGASAKRLLGATKLSAGLSYGWYDTDTFRSGSLSSPFATKVDRKVKLYSALVRVSHDFEQGHSYIRPALDLGITHLRAESADEEGAGALSLQLESYSENHTWVRPALFSGREFLFDSGNRLRLSAELAYQHSLSDPSTDVKATFAGAFPGVDNMTVPIDLDRNIVEGSLGIELLTSDSHSVKLEYTYAEGDRYRLKKGGLKVSVPF
ncbi:hypothetical protein MIB92_03175 [Aestuariirhabdus sp. Z084]|uniref:autotransporter outer membrane beta-barrel domain-containing protein n=1 Tax=Aestuariirhabdus haliotis TaxID=2918751 RepID=UPI0020BD59A9|nr:autotransporter outer membrane beta-barrel domain-containing protein [Aestuariirhabdus haliotis]MCL6414642.1 hypothetical protein [Aestuariirhabdus haliotis]